MVFAFAYLAVRILHLALFSRVGRRSRAPPAGVGFSPSVLGSTALLLVASQLDGSAQTIAWVAVLFADYVGTILAGASGWRLNSASHFAERHGLIIIIALGESIVAIGVGVAQLPVSWPVIVASVLGLTVAGGIWWAYFDVVAILAERALRQAQGEERARFARDAYSYLHLPMIAGVVLIALGPRDGVGVRRRCKPSHAQRAARTLTPLRAVPGCRAVPARSRGLHVSSHPSREAAEGRHRGRDRPARSRRGGHPGSRRPGMSGGGPRRTDRVRIGVVR